MSLFLDVVASIVVGLIVTGIGAACRLAYRARTAPPQPPRALRRYTLLRTPPAPTAPPSGTRRPVPPERSSPTEVGGHPHQFDLTDAPLGDGTYAAEPLERPQAPDV